MTYYPGMPTDEVNILSRVGRKNPLATGAPQEIPVAIDLTATDVVANVKMPVNIGIVLDRSGSMGDQGKMKQAIESACQLVQQMQPNDFISVVAFHEKAKVIVKHQPVTNVNEICKEIRKLKPDDGTDISEGLGLIFNEISQSKYQGPALARRIILLTDGETSNGDACLRISAQIGQAGIPLYALGLGSDWNSEFMEDLVAQNVAFTQVGRTVYLPDPSHINNIFQEVFTGAQNSVINNLRLTFRFSMGVTPIAVYRIFPLIADLGFQPISDREIMVQLGELEKGNPQSILVRATIGPRPPGQFRMGQIEASYDVPALGIYGKRIRNDVLLDLTTNPNLANVVDPDVMNLSEKVRAFKLQTIALIDMNHGNVQGATIKLNQAVTILFSQGDTQQANAIQAELQNIQKSGAMSEQGEKTIQFNKSKTIRFN